jgi:hypothetical protein
MAKKKKPAAKKPARRPFHEGGMIDMELQMLENMAQDAIAAARDSVAGGGNPEALDQIFDQLSMGISQVRDINRKGIDKPPIDSPRPRPNPNVPQPKITPEQEQAARRMNQAQFMRPRPQMIGRPAEYPDGSRPPPIPRFPTRPMPDQPNIPKPIFITPEEQARRDALENNRNPQLTGPRYADASTGGSRYGAGYKGRPSNFTPGPRRPQRIAPTAFDRFGRPLPSRPVPTPTINPLWIAGLLPLKVTPTIIKIHALFEGVPPSLPNRSRL